MEKRKKFLTIQDMALIALFTALTAVCSWISISAGPVPFTLQTFAVFTTAGLLGAKRGTVSVIVYILLGMVGVPVFAGFKAGMNVIVGPTGGYIIGFIFTALIIGIMTNLFKDKDHKVKMVMLAVSMILGDAVCFVIGTFQFMYVADMSFTASLSLCVIPYIIPDLIKIIVAVIVVDRMKKYMKVFR